MINTTGIMYVDNIFGDADYSEILDPWWRPPCGKPQNYARGRN